jgi:hypothetical protein
MRGWQRWWPVAGIVYVVLFVVVAFFAVGDTGNSAVDTARILPTHHTRLGFGLWLVVVAVGFLLFFMAGLRDVVRAAAPEQSILSTLTFAPAVAAAALIPGSVAILVGGAQGGHEAHGLSPQLAAFVLDAQYPFLVAAYMLLGLALAAASVALLGRRVLPGWLCWAGIVTGVLQLIAFMFFPMGLVLLWLIAAAIYLMRWTPQTAPAP